MKPLRLTLKAFGSYGALTYIPFSDIQQNLFLITGNTGSGKSTIFDAIVFALYGEASSNANKKDGIELQSQYSDVAEEPFVELEFSEIKNGVEEIYRIHRVPRHLAPKRGGGLKEVKETVSLFFQDGSEYASSQKETDQKIADIVGLSKVEFTQIAMIAQGEFMDLLRAKSEDKKKIFRKLFHTDIYQKVVDALNDRKKAMDEEIRTFQTIFSTNAGKVQISRDDSESLLQMQRKVTQSQQFHAVDAEQFLDALAEYMDSLEHDAKETELAYQSATKEDDAAQSAYTIAWKQEEQFLQLFNLQEEKKLHDASLQEIETKKAFAKELQAAFKTNAVYLTYAESKSEAEKTAQTLKENQEKLPVFKAVYEQSVSLETTKQAAFDEIQKTYHQAETAYRKAMDRFVQIERLQKEHQQLSNLQAKHTKAMEDNATSSSKLEEVLCTKQTRYDALQNTDAELVKAEAEETRYNEYQFSCREIKEREVLILKQQAVVGKEEAAYEKELHKYQEQEAACYHMQMIYFDSQAGYLAKEKLRDNEPCPVCGSLHHPHPCVLEEGMEVITREQLDKASKANLLQREVVEEKAVQLSSAREKLNSCRKQNEEALLLLQNKMQKPSLTLEQLIEHITDGLQQAQQKKAECKALQNEKGSLQKEIAETKQHLESLLSLREKMKEELADTLQKIAVNENNLKNQQEENEYASKEEAEKRYQEILSAFTQSRKELDTIKAHVQEQKTSLDKCVSTIELTSEQLPSLLKKMEEKKSYYEQTLLTLNMEEERWKELVEKYELSDVDAYENEVRAYEEKTAVLTGQLTAVEAGLKGVVRADISVLQKNAQNTREAKLLLENKVQNLRAMEKNNRSVYKEMQKIYAERLLSKKKYDALDDMYEKLSGKKPGARMDVETFVQRYYLQHILYHANMRFSEMTAGQFELRMKDSEKAGEGKNRGLDLVVYSNVTGRIRDVNTLSGGESFMAALSLALGMADEIQRRSSAIHLDMMFIDEGFGSLDDHARNEAVRVLQRMAGGSKLIGIISHVTELKQAIPTQLSVTKDQHGSHVKWEIE